jgi:hypothetical protein
MSLVWGRDSRPFLDPQPTTGDDVVDHFQQLAASISIDCVA